MEHNQSENRKRVFRALLITTILVAAAVASAFLASRMIPAWKQQKLESAIESGDTALARKLAEKAGDEERLLILQQCSYIDAEALEKEGKLREASALFAEAGSYEDASERRKQCDYQYAVLLEEEGLWDDAADAFRALGAYADAADRVPECLYRKALSLLESGNKWEAAEILDSLSNMQKANELFMSVLKDLTGYEGERAIAVFHGMSEEELKKLSDLSEQRASLPQGIIDVGFYHTVGLSRDGRVYACGDNSFGQCETDGFSGAIAVAAGAWHTAVLLKDGSVKCVGRNTEKQCETAGWKNVVQIAASDYATFALCSDGTVLSTGFLDYEEVRSWTGIRSISAGSYGIAGQRNDGSLWFYPEMPGIEKLENVESLAISTGYAAAALKDGSVSCTAFDLPDWKNVLSVYASGTAVLALESGGFIDSCFFRESDAVDFSNVMDAVAVAAGSTHFAVVFSDGSVKVFGSSEHGEGDTNGWVLAAD